MCLECRMWATRAERAEKRARVLQAALEKACKGQLQLEKQLAQKKAQVLGNDICDWQARVDQANAAALVECIKAGVLRS